MHLESRVSDQAAQLEQMNYSQSYNSDDNYHAQEPVQPANDATDEDIQRELEEIRDLEKRKRALEDRISGMDRDLGGLLR